MKEIPKWKRDPVEREKIKKEVYEAVLEEPYKAYSDLSNQFTICVPTLRSMLKEYCEENNLENPKKRGINQENKKPGSKQKRQRNKKRELKEFRDERIIEGKKCVVQKENVNTLIVIFEGTSELIVVTKKGNKVISKINNHDYNNPKRGRRFATY